MISFSKCAVIFRSVLVFGLEQMKVIARMSGTVRRREEYKYLFKKMLQFLFYLWNCFQSRIIFTYFVIFSTWLFFLKTFKAPNGLLCADVALRNYSFTHSVKNYKVDGV